MAVSPDVYTEHGKKSIDNIYMYNEQAQLSGEVIMKVSSVAVYFQVHS